MSFSQQSAGTRASYFVRCSASDPAKWLSRFGVTREFVSADAPLALNAAPDTWSAHEAERLVRRITPSAREALEQMALSAPELAFDDLQDALGMNGVQIALVERALVPRLRGFDGLRRS